MEPTGEDEVKLRTDVELRNDELEEALKSDDENAIKAQLVKLEEALVNLAVPWHVLGRLREATLRTHGRPCKKQRVVDPRQEDVVDPRQEHLADIDLSEEGSEDD